MSGSYTEMTLAQIKALAREFAWVANDNEMTLVIDNTPHEPESIELGVGVEDTIIRDTETEDVLCWVSPQGRVFKNG